MKNNALYIYLFLFYKKMLVWLTETSSLGGGPNISNKYLIIDIYIYIYI
jgi:hypothetical protein